MLVSKLIHLSSFFSLSNEEKYLKLHYDLDVLPEDRSTLPKYNSDVCKWHLFFSNLTEDVYQVLVDIFTLDYKRELHFQTLTEETFDVSAEPKAVIIPETDTVLKGLLLWLLFCSDIRKLNVWLVSVLLLGAYDKLSARAKGTTVRQVLSGTVFLNFHHLHPEFQKYILLRIQTVYKSKKEVQADVTFFLIVSVSVTAFTTFTLKIVRLQQNCAFIPFIPAISLFYYVCFLGVGHWMSD